MALFFLSAARKREACWPLITREGPCEDRKDSRQQTAKFKQLRHKKTFNFQHPTFNLTKDKPPSTPTQQKL
jgi:hypothetical protein